MQVTNLTFSRITFSRKPVVRLSCENANNVAMRRMIYSARFIQQTHIFSALCGVRDLRREGHIVPSARQSITWSPPSSRRRSYPVGKLPDEFLVGRRVRERKQEDAPRRRGREKYGNEERTYRKNQRTNTTQ
ncbi:PREDICTED: uncharacterized protein LOC105559026 isoform X1 [Vollenhovia emeryi]|uniref:uncharacterized protein LOC105559026 isoform X1 n=1 Tax=Vollenhovia emeryi TaxID=411798 RepID=UPI0005F37DA8|nr:PREDICTED: uncharacterized protein LOC105559026 isoform X1 [Vollenhovia emeryi]